MNTEGTGLCQKLVEKAAALLAWISSVRRIQKGVKNLERFERGLKSKENEK